MNKIILGFDISSTTTAYCALNYDDETKVVKFISADYIKPIKIGSIMERIVNTRDKIKKIIEDIKPDYIAIEDIISFMQGKSTATTVITLTTFNRMVCLLAYDYLKIHPHLCNVMSIRHALKENKVFPTKQDMPELVAKHLEIKFPYEYNKKGKVKIENEDKADAMAVALYYSFILSGKIKDKKIKVKKDKKKNESN